MILTNELLVLLIGYSLPLVISPGPGNALLAASGARFGVQKSIPFWIGFESANIVLCLVYGLGLGKIFEQFPILYTSIKWGGILYIAYLGYTFIKPTALTERDDIKPLNFIDGFISVSMNPKIHTMILVLFTQFLDPTISLALQMANIIGVFLVVCIFSHFVWIWGGQVIFSRFKSDRSLKIQAYFFGGSLFLVAAYMALT